MTLIWLGCTNLHAQSRQSEVAGGAGEITAAPAPISPECRPLTPGQSLTINQDRDQSNTGIPKTYRLTRDRTNRDLYIAEFNINFTALEPTMRERFIGDAANPMSPTLSSRDFEGVRKPFQAMNDYMRAAMIARTRECFGQMQNRLMTSDGTQIELRLATPNTEDPPPQTTISINTSDARANSQSWTSQISCPTIIHEVMHLMGLCDGYRESQIRVSDTGQILQSPPAKIPPATPGKVSQNFVYNCRSVEPQGSVMHNQTFALAEILEVRSCPFPESSTAHSEQVQDTLPSQCPDGSPGTLLQMTRASLTSRVTQQRRPGVQPSSRFFYYYRVMPPRSDTILPAQMRMITMPLCNQLNENYITCAQNAYRTLQIEGCVNVPPFCQTTDYLR